MPDSSTKHTLIAARVVPGDSRARRQPRLVGGNLVAGAFALLCALILNTSAARAAGYVYGESQSFRTEGVVSMVDPDRDRVTITASDGRQYNLDTGDTIVHLRTTTQPGETGDLVVGMHVQVSGRLLSSSVVAADTVTVLPYDGNRPADPQPSYRNVEHQPDGSQSDAPAPAGADKHIRLRGTVAGVDDQDGILTVHVLITTVPCASTITPTSPTFRVPTTTTSACTQGTA